MKVEIDKSQAGLRKLCKSCGQPFHSEPDKRGWCPNCAAAPEQTGRYNIPTSGHHVTGEPYGTHAGRAEEEARMIGEAAPAPADSNPATDALALLYQLANERERNTALIAALKLCYRELEGMHSYHHPTCPGGCPFDYAAQAARAAITQAERGNK